MWNRALEVSPNLRIDCGVERRINSRTSPKFVSGFLETLVAPFGFSLPTQGLLGQLNLTQGVYDLISEHKRLQFASVTQLAQAVSDLDSLKIALLQMDSEEFAIWCGLGKNNSRDGLLTLIHEIDQALVRVREARVKVDFEEYRPGPKALVDSLTQLALTGVACDVKQIKKAWPQSGRKPLTPKWKSRIGSVRVCEGTGTLIEVSSMEYTFLVKWTGAAHTRIDVGILRNHLVLDLGGVRRFLELPAACSRMESIKARVSLDSIEIDFMVNEKEWPRS